MKVTIDMDESFDELVVARLKDSEHTLLLCIKDITGHLEPYKLEDLYDQFKTWAELRSVVEYYTGDYHRPFVFPDKMNEEYDKINTEIFRQIKIAPLPKALQPKNAEERKTDKAVRKAVRKALKETKKKPA